MACTGSDLYYKRLVSVELAEDSQFTELTLKRDRCQRTASYEAHVSQLVTIAGGATYVVPMGSVADGRVLYLEANGSVNLLINGGTDPMPVRQDVAGEEVALLMDGTSITSLSLVNPIAGGADVKVSYVLAGNE